MMNPHPRDFSRQSPATGMSCSSQKAFSLVEVAMAIGIVAFAFVALLGMLPTGMNTFQKAMETSLTSQIADKIASDLQGADFYTLLSEARLPHQNGTGELHAPMPRRYFDDQGTEIVVQSEPPSAGERRRILYEAVTRISRMPEIPVSFVSTITYESSDALARYQIQVVTNPQGVDVQVDPSTHLIDTNVTKASYVTYAGLLSRNSRKPPQNSP